MRAAGLPASSCFGPRNPVATWHATWDAVVRCDAHGPCALLLLPDRPPASMAGGALNQRRLCPRESLAPPPMLPPACVQIYVAPGARGGAFGACTVVGGDAELDDAAQLRSDAAARVVLERSSALYRGATAASPTRKPPCVR